MPSFLLCSAAALLLLLCAQLCCCCCEHSIESNSSAATYSDTQREPSSQQPNNTQGDWIEDDHNLIEPGKLRRMILVSLLYDHLLIVLLVPWMGEILRILLGEYLVSFYLFIFVQTKPFQLYSSINRISSSKTLRYVFGFIRGAQGRVFLLSYHHPAIPFLHPLYAFITNQSVYVRTRHTEYNETDSSSEIYSVGICKAL